MVYFGIDCAAPAPAAIAAAQRVYGSIDFVWRYTEELAGYSTGLTTQEVAEIHAANVALGLVYNGMLPADVQAGYTTGAVNAGIAARHARAIGAPDGVVLACDVEAGWLPTADCFAGWITNLHAAGYLPGVYCNVQEQTHVQPLLAAYRRCGLPLFVWSSEPEWTAWWNERRADWYDFAQTPLGTDAGLVQAHQYGEGELAGAVDLDLVSDAGWPLLWHRVPPTPPPVPGRKQVISACGLKPLPKHGGRDLATIPATGQVADSAKRRGCWAYVQWRDQYGWIEAGTLTDLPTSLPPT